MSVTVDVHDARLRDLDEAAFARRYSCDRLTASILVNRFRYVNAHMATKLRTNAFSVVIRDMDDFCTTIQGPPEQQWAMPATSFTNPVHWGPVTDSVGIVLEEIGLDSLRAGDVVVCNDSYRTGKHLNDMSFIRPLFHDGRLIGAVHVTAHQLDVGSRIPGGFDPLSASIWEDGLVLTPMFLYREGEPVTSTFSLIAANTRYPDVILADLQVVNATLDLGEELLLESVARYGIDAYLGGIRYACDVASEEMTRAIAALPDGDYEGEHVIGDDGRPGAPTYGVRVTVRKRGTRLEFDFSGTSEQSPTSLNCSWLDAKTGVIVALKELFDRRSVPSSGSLRNIDFLLPAESIVNAAPPTATMSYYTLVETVIRATRAALNPMVGQDAIAFDATFGNAGGHRAAGVDPDGTPWATSAVVANVPTFPRGASVDGDADGYALTSSLNMTNLSVEVLELSTPILLLEVEAVADTAGPGAHRGGTSIASTHQYRYAARHHHGAPPTDRGAEGVWGGGDGRTGRAEYFGAADGGALPLGVLPTSAGDPMPSSGMVDAGPGAIFRATTPSAGGWGNPFDRDLALVVRDVRDGYVTVAGAARDYGVVVVGDPDHDPEHLTIDEAATATLPRRGPVEAHNGGASVSDIRLDGKVAIVTGATGGWGSGAAYALAERGAAVVCNSRTQTKLDAFADRLTQQGGTAVGIAQDIRTLDGATKLVERAVEQFGRVDILVNSAGVRVSDNAGTNTGDQPLGLYGGPLLDLTEDAWNLVIHAELTGIFTCTKAAVTQMVAQGDGGAVISVVGTFVGAAGQSSHAAAKSGVLGAMWSWSDELRSHGITCNSVRGYVRSLLTDPAFNTDDFDFSKQREGQLLPTEPAEAGELIAWLASPEAAHVTGAYIMFDGPRVMLWDPQKPDTAVFHQPRWTAEDLADTLGPIMARRPARFAMTDLVMDLFNQTDREHATRYRSTTPVD